MKTLATKSEIFKAAHKLTKETRKATDSYSATFSICLKYIYSQLKNTKMEILATIDLNATKSTDSKTLTICKQNGIFCGCIDNETQNFDTDDRGFESIAELSNYLVKRELKRCSIEVINNVKQILNTL